MLDRWVYGNAERLSPEAPVPVLKKVPQDKALTGGAGNTAEAIAALGGTPVCLGVVGEDAAGGQVSQLLAAGGAEASHLIRLADRPTTVKTRYVGLAQHRHAQQMFRVDAEVTEPLGDQAADMLAAAVRSEIKMCDALALEDYDKGVLSDVRAPELIAEARRAGKPVVVDPAYIDNYRRYRGATLLTPNRYEASRASGIRIVDDQTLERAARQILVTTEAQAVVITMDKEGMYLLCRDAPGRQFPHPRPRSAYDVSGAGDEVLAALAVAVAAGCPYEKAVQLANIAGGLEVEVFGVVPISRGEIAEELRCLIGLRRAKVTDRTPLARELQRRRARGQTVVFTNGCFDLLHMGHVRYLQEARELGSCLVVAINSDDSVRRQKGPTRPIIDQDERGEMLASLECVDYVTIFDEDTPEALLELLRPDLLVKGGTTPEIVGRELVQRYGGAVQTLSKVDGLSTTDIIERILAAYDKND